ncbi:acetate/propionate family kinase [Tuwongella immobilis]|uniref:Acetate kinase n=1 Tax=Tuwongella immobilis TaxID=692036 RepID=A0A6C2YPK4_9BACT|nr:acetate/propionate family kinase [Tuwongella immobilis]VIP03558.1 acetate kinase : Acetate kinase OS=Nitrobacter hamburgensis (strain X14 / DSM 10229) GN=ackA PE=3 SV=1: Acetate_kinase [Tuwongella immobilis]VTS04484.1 acetate kinase : Acetate kinase OS=Nitrobacter hamburgensis (strain X14 / DSM 10229) GN=ackA PE=3 SV=1: Acetate_kinase [Tuwongella immobilis]
MTAILTINSGSSSLKFAEFQIGPPLHRSWHGQISRIGQGNGQIRITTETGDIVTEESHSFDRQADALTWLFQWWKTHTGMDAPAAIGHRVVHGGTQFTEPERVSPDFLQALKTLQPLAPDHLPPEIRAMELIEEQLPNVPQIACFDTAFHRSIPPVAQRLPLLRTLAKGNLRRYGFHGLSYAYLLQQLRELEPELVAGRWIFCHLGNGSSLAAVKAGQCVETTMGMTPLGGLMMGSRPGEIDPGVILHLLRSEPLDPDGLAEILQHHSGLKGVSGISSDMAELLALEATEAHAAEAVALFVYTAKKAIGALAAVLDGIDGIVFTGGIGENSPIIRERILDGLAYLGVMLDATRNHGQAAVLSPEGHRPVIRRIVANEEAIIAQQTAEKLGLIS